MINDKVIEVGMSSLSMEDTLSKGTLRLKSADSCLKFEHGTELY